MRLLSPARARQLQRTLKNLRVSLLCFLLTFLVLRNTIGAGKFGTPAQDFEEIRQHLYHGSLHRKHARVLTEVQLEGEENLKDSSSQSTLENGYKHAPSFTASLVREVSKGNAASLNELEASSIIDLAENRRAIASEQRSYGDDMVLLVTGSKSSVCDNPAGQHFLLKSLKNKVDYSRRHGFEVFYSDGYSGTSSSRVISLLQGLMNKHPQVEWLWWVNAEVVITDVAFELPLLNYTGVNVVLVGSDEAISNQERSIDLYKDSFLIRNSQWSLDILHNWTAQVDFMSTKENRNHKVMLREGEVFVEKARVLRGHWQRMAEMFGKKATEPDVGKMPFMTHFLGCNPCGMVGDMEMEVCVKHMEKTLDFVDY